MMIVCLFQDGDHAVRHSMLLNASCWGARTMQGEMLHSCLVCGLLRGHSGKQRAEPVGPTAYQVVLLQPLLTEHIKNDCDFQPE